MIIKLIAAASFTLVADLPLSLKDSPSETRSAVTQPRAPIVEHRRIQALPGVLVPTPRPYIKVEGYPGRMAMTPAELKLWMLKSGDVVSVEKATLIVKQKMRDLGLKTPD